MLKNEFTQYPLTRFVLNVCLLETLARLQLNHA